MSKTLQDIKSTFYSILNEQEDSPDYWVSFVDELLNNAQRLICSGWVYNLRSQQKIQKGVLPFLNKNQFYTTVNDTSITTTVWSLSDVTLAVSSTVGYPTTGTLYINGDIVSYTGKTTTSFTGVSGLSFLHQAGTQVSMLFPLPTDHATTIRVIYNNYSEITYIDERNLYSPTRSVSAYPIRRDYLGGSNHETGYTIYGYDGGMYLLPFGLNQPWLPIRLQYEKKPTEMTQNTDLCTIPDEFINTIPYVAVAEMLYNRGQEDSGLMINDTLAVPRVQALYNYYNNQHSELPFNQRVTTSRDVSYNF